MSRIGLFSLLIGLNFICLNTTYAIDGGGFKFPNKKKCSASTLPTYPEKDLCFLKLTNGFDLTSVKVSNRNLSVVSGTSSKLSKADESAFLKLKDWSKTDIKAGLQWALVDLSNGRFLDQSLSSDRRMFGASVSKVFVAAALLDWNNGSLESHQWQLMADMLVVSSNTAWVKIQNEELGEGKKSLGQQRINDFTKRMGYLNTRGFQGYWGNIHGNELNPQELGEFLYDTYQNRYAGAEVLWKLLFTSRTGTNRGKLFIPSSQYIGGKTGTYAGATVDPYTGDNINVSVRHHIMVFNKAQKTYGLVILSDKLSEAQVALFAGGIYKQIKTKKRKFFSN